MLKRLNFANAPSGSINALQRAQLGIGYPFVLGAIVIDYCDPVAYPGSASTHTSGPVAYPGSASSHAGAPVAYQGSAYQVEHCLQNPN